ncbi:hypothetical protein QUO12_002243 [Vibrio parahaemolyticus]|nr:hypothetical protein [Vibrio parahaemolyticus]
MGDILPFSITNEMAVLISLFGPPIGKWIYSKARQHTSKAKELALFRGLRYWKRERRLKHIKKLRRTRSIEPLVNDQIAQANTYFLIFWIMVLFYTYLLIGSPVKEVFNINKWMSLLLASPIYYFEIKWLVASGKKQELLRVMRRKRA